MLRKLDDFVYGLEPADRKWWVSYIVWLLRVLDSAFQWFTGG